jgi:acetyltransferase EpsM
MKKVIIVGAGGHAAELNDYIRVFNNIQSNEKISIVGFLDDDLNIYSNYEFDAPYLGPIKTHQIDLSVYYLMGIANINFRKSITLDFIKKGAKFTGFIHPSSVVSPSAKVHETVVISHSTSIGPKVKIGQHNLINSRCTIGHDTSIGEFNFISPLVAFSGNSVIGNENLIGTGTITLPGIKIGNSNNIGAGTVVIQDISDHKTVVGCKPQVYDKK